MQIQDIMTTQIHVVRDDLSLREVAQVMRDEKIGDVLVIDHDGSLCGILTDRDIVVRADAAGKPLDKTRAADICTDDVIKLAPSDSVEDAVRIMRDYAIRRIPVVRDDHPVGIITIGDLARYQDPRSALAQISAAAPNN